MIEGARQPASGLDLGVADAMAMGLGNEVLGGVALESGQRIEFCVQRFCWGPTGGVELGHPGAAMSGRVERLAASKDAP